MIRRSFPKRVLTVVALLCLLVAFLSAQVHIREKIQIQPSPAAVKMQAGGSSTTHTLTVAVRWDQPWFGYFDTYTPCGLRRDTGTAQIAFTIDPAPGGNYPHLGLFLSRPAGQTASVVLELSYDGQLVYRDSTGYGQFSSGWPDIAYDTPHFDGFRFNLPDEPAFYESSTIGEVTGANQCGSSTSWTPSKDSVRLSIVSGREYAQFWQIVDDLFGPRIAMGSRIIVSATELPHYVLAADGLLPDSQGVHVYVLAESNGIEQLDSIKIVPYFLKFIFNPDSIRSGEQSRVIVKTVDTQGEDYFRVVSPLIRVAIKDSTMYGTLSYQYSNGSVIAQGDTVNDIETLFIGDDQSRIELKFLANENTPSQTFPVALFAEKTGEGSSESFIPLSLYPFPARDTVRGKGFVVLKPGDSLTIAIPEQRTIWPTLPSGRSGGNPGNRNRKDSILVQMLRSGQPAVGDSVLIQTKFVESSGGHHHTIAPPDSLMGTMQLMLGNTSGKGEIRLATDDSEKILIRYIAPLFGGRIEFIARRILDTTLVARDTLTVKVDSLLSLEADTTYELVGAPDNHAGTNDPCRTVQPPSRHFANHYGTLSMVRAVDRVAANYHRLDPNIRLRINDLSLEWGGLFDIPNNWKDDPRFTHNEHRIGKSADIGFSGITNQSVCDDVNRPLLVGLINLFTTDAYYPHTNHYHIRMR